MPNSAALSATTYDDLHALHGYRDRGERERETVTVGRNTKSHLHRTPHGDNIYITLHDHKIVCLFENGRIAINIAGWPTMTTRDRIQRFLHPKGYRISQTNGVRGGCDGDQWITTPNGDTHQLPWQGWVLIDERPQPRDLSRSDRYWISDFDNEYVYGRSYAALD